MKKITQHILFKQVANLIITGTVFIILFGHGVHIHTMFDQLLDHGHIHVTLHAHASDDQPSNSGLADLENETHHQHSIASIDLSGTLKQSVNQIEPSDSDIFKFAVSEQVYSILKSGSPTLLAQPPPDLKFKLNHSFFYSLRAPPVA